MKSPQEWKNYFENRGIDQNFQIIYLDYIAKLHSKNIPIIFETEHLAHLVGIEYRAFINMINGTESFYRSFTIPKRNSKQKRLITVPYPSLKSVQQWINREILSKQEVHPCAHGYVKRKSILSNAEKHVGKKAFLKIDLKDFFPSINMNRVMRVFLDMGYPHNISYYLSSLCTLNNMLPQGAPTSPTLSNIISIIMDKRLYALSSRFQIEYTRYADDMAFSGNYIPHNFKTVVFSIIHECGFEENEQKSYLSTKQGKRILTGLSISDDTLKLPRSVKRSLKREVYYIQKYGYFSHISKKKINNPAYLESLHGKLVFWKHVEPNSTDAIKALGIIRELMIKFQNN